MIYNDVKHNMHKYFKLCSINFVRVCCHRPQGRCGLKFDVTEDFLRDALSSPARAVWIEIHVLDATSFTLSSSPARAVWIEMSKAFLSRDRISSSPARAVWIEIGVRQRHNHAQGSSPARAVWIEI